MSKFSEAARKNNQKLYEEYIERWKRGEESGQRGKEAISAHVRRYLFEKYDSKCCECQWSKINPTTGKVPLEVEHIDGCWTNNKEENLKLLCPCCHSLTSTYRSLNRGKGRKVRLHKIAEQTVKEAWQSGLLHSP
jgi:hypothetical protein